MSAPRVEVVLDFVCVHSYLGFTRFLRAVEAHRRTGGEVEVRFAPFQLRPDASSAGEPLFELHARERGESVAREIATSSIGEQDGLRLNFRRAIFTNTFEAHRLLAAASEQDSGEVMAERLFRAYFTDGLNIADPSTLTALADEVGVAAPVGGADSLRAELDRVRALGIDMLPVFRFPSGTITGSGEVERFHRALRELI
ncbi:DsbA family protein [Saccharopolyspora sp. NPDC049426]|uniref:DsbA family oxidoreductase n=1 Tax=Saccharopolyspora sp. NPDC049426 TaxID=3155652 RepID=UPI0034444D1D